MQKLEKNTATGAGETRKLLLFNQAGGGVNQLVEPGWSAIYAYPDTGQLLGNNAFQFSCLTDASIYSTRNTGDVYVWGCATAYYPYGLWTNYNSSDSTKFAFPVLYGAISVDSGPGNVYGPTVSYYTSSPDTSPQISHAASYT